MALLIDFPEGTRTINFEIPTNVKMKVSMSPVTGCKIKIVPLQSNPLELTKTLPKTKTSYSVFLGSHTDSATSSSRSPTSPCFPILRNGPNANPTLVYENLPILNALHNNIKKTTGHTQLPISIHTSTCASPFHLQASSFNNIGTTEVIHF
ncbi:MSP domain-containing protein [Caenorhabditis elegans]|uniref:MSP domain-containing protein n=1 Tax=Caenorhabditis elegans TaxID=6239 RepID=H2L2B0_CAEEL|nr:MSP domain-containing protein [Caenorhabditis elegans]CCE71323.1 MSP domain-containing protein [Caenorhabditis elegans]|eukprot:NP_001257165.1 Uncharacterized protein CELE_C44C10.15 [Caenorhabditis elegans]